MVSSSANPLSCGDEGCSEHMVHDPRRRKSGHFCPIPASTPLNRATYFKIKTTFPSEPFSLRRGPDNIQLIRGGRSLPNVTHCTRSTNSSSATPFFQDKSKLHAKTASQNTCARRSRALPPSLSSPLLSLPSLSLPSVPPTPSPSPYVLLFGRFGLFRTISKIKTYF